VEYSFERVQRVKALQIYFIKPPGEFKLEYTSDGVNWITYRPHETDANDWRIGLTEEQQKKRKNGGLFFDSIWDATYSGHTITDVFDSLKPILKVRYTLRSPVMWHYGIWYATAYTQVYNAQIIS